MKPKVLVTFPRFGSTWIQKHINKYNSQFGMQDLYDYFGKKNRIDVESKLNFLEDERSNFDQEYSIKYMTYHEPVNTPWFKSFYCNYEIVRLRRKDVYGAYLSYLTQYATGWNYHNAKNNADKDRYNKACNRLIIHQKAIDEWFTRYKTFINFTDYDTEIVYEEFVPDDPSVTNTIPYNIDYESRITNISFVKDEYERCMKLLN